MRPEALLFLALAAASAQPAPDPGTEAGCVASYLPKEMGEEMGITPETWREVCALGIPREDALKEALRRTRASRPAESAAPPVKGAAGAFDGDRARAPGAFPPAAAVLGALEPFASADGKVLNVCGEKILESPSLPLRSIAVVPNAVCVPDGGSKALEVYRELGGLGRVGALRARLENRALSDPNYAQALRRYYERVRAVDARRAPSEAGAGWAWRLALEQASGDARLAMSLVGFCGHDDLAPADLRVPREAGEARRDLDAERTRLQRRVDAAPSGAPSDDALSRAPSALAANDRSADRERLGTLRAESFAEARERICPDPDSVFYRPGGLTAESAAARGSGRGPSMSHRVYESALLACEMIAAGASPSAAERAPVNGAWAAQLLRLRREAEIYGHLRSGLESGDDSSGRWFLQNALAGPAGPVPARSRMDALLLLELSGAPDANAAAWTAPRRRAAERALAALRADWERALAQRTEGARFGANACAQSKAP